MKTKYLNVKPGDKVKGIYLINNNGEGGFPFTGTVEYERVETVSPYMQQIYIKLDKKITVFGSERNSIIGRPDFEPIEIIKGA